MSLVYQYTMYELLVIPLKHLLGTLNKRYWIDQNQNN